MTAGIHQFESKAEQHAALRRAFGRFGTGVTVVSTMTDHGPLGITANSFSSVSLEPALVLWAPALNSMRHDAFVAAAHFCIHVLAADQLAMAEHFARQGSGFDRFEWGGDAFGSPMLHGCLAAFHCRTHAVHPAGDHSLVLGEVLQVSEHASDRPGLMFDRGRFGQFRAGSEGGDAQ